MTTFTFKYMIKRINGRIWYFRLIPCITIRRTNGVDICSSTGTASKSAVGTPVFLVSLRNSKPRCGLGVICGQSIGVHFVFVFWVYTVRVVKTAAVLESSEGLPAKFRLPLALALRNHL